MRLRGTPRYRRRIRYCLKLTHRITRHGRPRGVPKGRRSKPVAGPALAIFIFAGATVATAANGNPDYGAPCCADLDQRIAELEATVARKGNRKVSLQLAGLVNNGVMAWDDGGERNAYVVTNDNQRSRFSFVGKAAIDAMWEAGYAIDIGLRHANSKLVNQLTDGDGILPRHFDLRSSVWFLRNKRYGTMFLGTTFAATDRIANSNVTQTGSFDQYAAPENAGLGMFLRSARDGRLTRSLLNWRRIIGAGGDQPGESQRGFSLIKYVSPTWNGFTAAADWVTTDFWDVALRYRKEVAGFDIGAGIGYLKLTPGSRTRSVCPVASLAFIGEETACSQVRGSVSAKHLETGLFVNFGASSTGDGIIDETTRYADTGVSDREIFYSGQAGIERTWLPLGKTTIYADYYQYNGGAATPLLVRDGDPLNPTGVGDWSVWRSSVDIWGGGLAQGIDSAETILYLTYKHVSGNLDLRQLQNGVASGPIADAPIDDLDLLLAGAVIRF
jgi:hypothetical protein